MRTRFALLLAALLAMALAGPARAWDGDYDDDHGSDRDDAPAPEQYEGALTPYGAWYDDGSLGRVWRPRVAIGWSPYVDGRWAWTSWGWTWLSWEPWAWTFHYGRWSWAPFWGWVWVPGTVWGPAWVSWHSGAGYVGWAPYGTTGFNHWTWVRDRDFCAPRIRHVHVGYQRVPSRVRTLWHAHEGGYAAPPRHDIERVSRHPVLTHPERPSGSLAPWHRQRADRGGGLPDRGPARGEPGPDGALDHRRGRDAPAGSDRAMRGDRPGGPLQHRVPGSGLRDRPQVDRRPGPGRDFGVLERPERDAGAPRLHGGGSDSDRPVLGHERGVRTPPRRGQDPSRGEAPRGSTPSPAWTGPRGPTPSPAWTAPRGPTPQPRWPAPRASNPSPAWTAPRGSAPLPARNPSVVHDPSPPWTASPGWSGTRGGEGQRRDPGRSGMGGGRSPGAISPGSGRVLERPARGGGEPGDRSGGRVGTSGSSEVRGTGRPW